MPDVATPCVGSGFQQFRKDNHSAPGNGKHNHGMSEMVMVTNWEDQIAAWGIFTSGVTVHLTAVRLPDRPSISGNWPGRRKISIANNNASGTLYVGPSGVTTANGWPIAVNTKETFYIAGTIDLWGIGSASGIDCRTYEES